MRQSQLFSKTERQAPKDEVAPSAKLLARAGFIYKNSAGVYSYLPLGWRVIQKIADIIREEMNAIGGQELFLPALVEKKYLDATGRWDVKIGYKVYGDNDDDNDHNHDDNHNEGDDKNIQGHSHRSSSSFALGWTHEEVLTAMAAKYVNSYKDLPFYAYQIQTKFRNEPRAKSGLLRTREFIMKDLYSFHASEADLMDFYEKTANTYRKIFKKCGLEAIYTVAAGGTFTAKNTHEFQVLADIGEDTIFVCDKCGYAENKEISKLKNGAECPKCPRAGRGPAGEMKEKKSIEVGNIFPLGTKYSEAFNLKFRDQDGNEKPVVMGSYGIGLGRLMATIAEVFHDNGGLIWPEAVSPYKVHLLEINGAEGKHLYEALRKEKIEVLYDERNVSAGEKLVDADLLGIAWRAIVSPKTGDKIEVKKRNSKESKLLSPSEFINSVS